MKRTVALLALLTLAAGAPAADGRWDAPAEDRPLTYAEAYHRALATGKPLLVWVGGNFCPRCVDDSSGEFVHCFVPAFEDAVSPSIVVSVVDGGQLLRVGDVQWWVENHREFGHLPSVRNVIRRWRDARPARRAVAQAAAVPVAFAAPAPVVTFAPPPLAPVQFRPAPVMMRSGPPPMRIGFGRARGGC